MDQLTVTIIPIAHYLQSLDWAYIITFIIISYGMNHNKAKACFRKVTGKTIKTRYRVLLVGVLYGTGIYFLRGYQLPQVEKLLQSFVFALVFHKLILDTLFYYLAKQVVPAAIAQQFLSEKQLKTINDNQRQ